MPNIWSRPITRFASYIRGWDYKCPPFERSGQGLGKVCDSATMHECYMGSATGVETPLNISPVTGLPEGSRTRQRPANRFVFLDGNPGSICTPGLE